MQIQPIEITCIAEDQHIRIRCMDAERADIIVRDMVSGRQKHWNITCEQAGSIMALLCSGDAHRAAAALYASIGGIFDVEPRELRPIP